MTIKICNKCGKQMDIFDVQEDFSIERDLGYGTSHDGDRLELHLCCECMDKLISECKISPIIDEVETEIKYEI